MSLLVVGLSHETAPVQIREKLALSQEEIPDLLQSLKMDGFLELAILSTCNRVEIYAWATRPMDEVERRLRHFLGARYPGVPVEPAIVARAQGAAVRHLFRVVSGLDSLVIGETEVLGQVKTAYLKAKEAGCTGKITNVLFQRALFVGKSVRNKTGISEGASSVGAVAVQLAEKIFGTLQARRLLLLGAGEMADVVARHLMSQKTNDLIILNRTSEKAAALAQKLGGTHGLLDSLPCELEKADIVICSTAAKECLVTRPLVESAMKQRNRSLYLIDIAVPRNVQENVAEIDDVFLYNIDDLKAIVNASMGERRSELEKAEAFVEKMAAAFDAWLDASATGQTAALRHQL